MFRSNNPIADWVQHDETTSVQNPKNAVCVLFNVNNTNEHLKKPPASVAQLEARPTGDQEVAGSTAAGSVTFCRGD